MQLNDFDVLEVDMGHVTPCHVPLSSKGAPFCLDADGYSTMLRRVDGRRIKARAHRVRYEAVYGTLPDGLVPDHLCKHRPCCNPAHMEAVTVAVNNRRGFRTKLTAANVIEIRAMAAAGIKQPAICARFQMSQSHISNVIHGKYWADGLSPAWEVVKARRRNAAINQG